MGRWLRHRPDGAGLRSEHLSSTGPWGRRCRGTRGPAQSREQETQECTQIGENGLSTLVWGVRVHCCDAIRQGVDPHKPPKSPSLRGIYSWLRGLGLDRIALRGKVQAKVGGEQPSRRGLPNGSHPPRTRVAKALPSRGVHDGTRRSRPTRWGRVPLQPERLELLGGLLDLYLDLLGVLADNGLEAK